MNERTSIMPDLVPIEHYDKYKSLLSRAKRVFIRLVTLLTLLGVFTLGSVLFYLMIRQNSSNRGNLKAHLQTIREWVKPSSTTTIDTVYIGDVSEVIVGNKLVVPNRPFNVEGLDVIYAGLVITAAYESFRERAYKDGKYPSVGFGFNLHPEHRGLFETLLHRSPCPQSDCMKTTVSKAEAVKLLKHLFVRDYKHYLKKYSNDERAALAAALRAYNRGVGSHNRHYVGSCCGAKVGCGHKDQRVRHSHMVRRLIETAILTGTAEQIRDIVHIAENKLVNKLGFDLNVFK